MSTFYVLGNLNHDGDAYKRGDAIELVDLAAPALIEMGILQTEPVTDLPPAPEPVAEEKPIESSEAAKVGGEATSMGEPSMDAPADAEGGEDKAPEVGPHAPAAAPAPVVPVTPAPEPVTPAPRGRGRQPAHKPEPAPKHDPSANL